MGERVKRVCKEFYETYSRNMKQMRYQVWKNWYDTFPFLWFMAFDL